MTDQSAAYAGQANDAASSGLPAWRAPDSRPTMLTAAGVAAVLGVVGWMSAGPLAALGVVLGTTSIVAFFVSGSWIIAWVSIRLPEMTLAAALSAYVLRLLGLTVVGLLFKAIGLPTQWTALGFGAAIFVWVVGMSITVFRPKPRLVF